ncbi:MAG: hypothetical protein J6T82_04640 [Bacteroidaceae bacterium]|nr:hypothetical protein [Bacteroidaceae bacterium]
MTSKYHIKWASNLIVSELHLNPHEIACAEKIYGNLAMSKERGNLCCIEYYPIEALSLNSSKSVVGIDIPCFIEKDQNSATRTIMIIGEAPRRNVCGKGTNLVLLGTPYAIQYKEFPEQCWVYKQIFKGLLDDYNLYLTDALKVWPKTCASTYSNKEWKDILKREILCVNPTMIVTFGRVAKNMLDQIIKEGPYGIDIRNVIHPSQMNNNLWSSLGVCPCHIPQFVLKFILENQGERNMYNCIIK